MHTTAMSIEPLMVRFRNTMHVSKPGAGIRGLQTLEVSTKTLE